MPKYINADEMIIDENEAYIKAQAKPKEYADFLVNQVVHLKLQRLLADAPAEDVQEVRHGTWLPDYETFFDDWGRESAPIQTGWRCSLCGRRETREEPYCHCGALMGESATDTNVGSRKE